MNIIELSRIDRAIDIAAPPERVWRALTSAAELSKWFQVLIDGPVAEGSKVWMTSQHEGYVGQRFQVRFVELTPPLRMVWEWHPGEVDAAMDYSNEPTTTVTFLLERAGAGTRLSVSETGFDRISLARRAKVHADNSQGWPEVLTWLKAHVETQQ